nr:MAG TPA: hypothetical protein [Bacteriophage sp.]
MSETLSRCKVVQRLRLRLVPATGELRPQGLLAASKFLFC